MDYMMVEPHTNEFRGFVSDERVRKELNLDIYQFRSMVMYNRLYRGCILIEDESEEEKSKKDIELWQKVDESSTGRVWYISNHLNVISVSKNGKKKAISPFLDKGAYRIGINGKVYQLYRLAYKSFINDIDRSVKVRLNGKKHVKNLYLVNNGLDGGRKRQKKVIANGKEYESIAECAKALGYASASISKMLTGDVSNREHVRYVSD